MADHSFGETFEDKEQSEKGFPVPLSRILEKLSKQEQRFLRDLLCQDPLGDIYKKTLIIYLTGMLMLLLWPFDFTFLKEKNNVSWLKDSNGIEFVQKGQVISPTPREDLCGRLFVGTGLSVEVWVLPQNTTQKGPARIVSYSLNTKLRNFTLGQIEKKLVMRLRTTETDFNGMNPQLVVDDVFDGQEPQHIIITYDFKEQSVFVNGDRRIRKDVSGGRFENWDPSYFFVLGNEATGDRPWLGKLFFVAVYNRALEEREVRRNYLVGWKEQPDGRNGDERVSDGLVVRYGFEEGQGDKVTDSAAEHAPVNLHIPEVIRTEEKPFFFDVSLGRYRYLWTDIVLNVLLFVPLGFLLAAVPRKDRKPIVRTAALVLLTGTLLTFFVEWFQYFSPTRNSSLYDVLSNMLGTAIGLGVHGWYAGKLRARGDDWLITEFRD